MEQIEKFGENHHFYQLILPVRKRGPRSKIKFAIINERAKMFLKMSLTETETNMPKYRNPSDTTLNGKEDGDILVFRQGIDRKKFTFVKI